MMLKRGSCELCGAACYIKCEACYAVLLFEGQDHNCPENCDIALQQICEECNENSEHETDCEMTDNEQDNKM